MLPGPISLERFAALSAEVATGAALERLLRREGLDAAVWEAAKQAWTAAMAAEVATQSFELTHRYQIAFRKRRRELTSSGTLDGTVSAPISAAAALPFRPSAKPAAHVETPAVSQPPSAPNRLGIEQLASLAAELARAQEDPAVIRARYGLDERGHAAELAYWTERFGREAGLLSRYDALLASYLEWLARSGH